MWWECSQCGHWVEDSHAPGMCAICGAECSFNRAVDEDADEIEVEVIEFPDALAEEERLIY